MKLLGIDYGTKKVGIAISDESGHFAFPYTKLKNDKNLIKGIADICQQEKVGLIVVGQPIDYHGKDNPIMEDIKAFALKLAEAVNLSVKFENEILTSKEAEQVLGRDEDTDARAASLILKSYIDRTDNLGV
jgi:putative Holliday junction resolvase